MRTFHLTDRVRVTVAAKTDHALAPVRFVAGTGTDGLFVAATPRVMFARWPKGRGRKWVHRIFVETRAKTAPDTHPARLKLVA